MRRRRGLVTVFTTLITLAFVVAFFRLLAHDGLSLFEALMIGFVATTKPHQALSLCSSAAGLALLALRGDKAAVSVTPLAPARPGSLASRTALAVPVRHEDAAQVMARLEATWLLIERTGHVESFELFVLSDSTDPESAAEEEALFEAWKRRAPAPERLVYRRREVNTGHKVGNLREFLAEHGRRFECMIVLDADSLMSGERVVHLAKLMEANPSLGLIQTLVTGVPALSPFTRFVQFGAKQGLRPYIVGKTWWQGDEASYWGHNAILRVKPYLEHCRVPRVPGPPPLGGEVLSHDHLEAVLLRRGGWGVHLLPEEGGTYEDAPPTLVDFVKRELRWCFGNLQYLKLLHLPALKPMGRMSLSMAALMYLAPAAWFAFILTGVLQLVWTKLGLPPLQLFGPLDSALWGEVSFGDFLLLYGLTMGLIFSVKLAGVVDLLARKDARRAMGGGKVVLAGIALELLFGFVMAPILGLAITVFIVGLACGKRLSWGAQSRNGRELSHGEAWAMFWPQTVAGTVILGALAWSAPAVLPWAAPLLAGLLLAVPFAVVTSRSNLGRWMVERRLAALPEELSPPPEVRLAGVMDGFPVGNDAGQGVVKPLPQPQGGGWAVASTGLARINSPARHPEGMA